MNQKLARLINEENSNAWNWPRQRPLTGEELAAKIEERFEIKEKVSK